MPTLTAIRQWCAKESGRFVSGTVKSSGNSTTTAVVTALISSISMDDIYNDFWLYFPTASAGDKVRTVADFTASTGTLTVDRAYSVSTVPDSKSFELHGTIRPFADDLTEASDWTQIINAALARCWMEWEFTVTPTANATRHDVTTANAWLTEPEWVRQVGWLGSNEARAEVDPYQGRIVYGYPEKISNLVYINHAPRSFDSNTTLYVKCVRPANTLIQAAGSGSFGAQTDMALEADVALPRLEWVGYAALVELANRQGMALAIEAAKTIGDKRAEWARMFSYWAKKETANLPEATFRPTTRIGVRRNTLGGR